MRQIPILQRIAQKAGDSVDLCYGEQIGDGFVECKYTRHGIQLWYIDGHHLRKDLIEEFVDNINNNA